VRWYVNDLSVQGQFSDGREFTQALDELLHLRRFSFIAKKLYCTRDEFRNRPVVGDLTVSDVLRSTPFRDFKRRALAWMDKFGPFLEDDRVNLDDDLFMYSGNDVTNQGLAEAARQILSGAYAQTFSFVGGALNFAVRELTVCHGLEDDPIGAVIVKNTWEPEALKRSAVAALPVAVTWSEVLAQCRDRFDSLTFSLAIDQFLEGTPFYSTVRDGVFDLLNVLQNIMENRAPGGKMSNEGMALVQKYFASKQAWFSDESTNNRRLFRSEMTFVDPENIRRRIVCFWHGKIQTPQFRVHFEWPVPAGQPRLKVVYIGPKISKA
jgi:hypothetical protein